MFGISVLMAALMLNLAAWGNHGHIPFAIIADIVLLVYLVSIGMTIFDRQKARKVSYTIDDLNIRCRKGDLYYQIRLIAPIKYPIRCIGKLKYLEIYFVGDQELPESALDELKKDCITIFDTMLHKLAGKPKQDLLTYNHKLILGYIQTDYFRRKGEAAAVRSDKLYLEKDRKG